MRYRRNPAVETAPMHDETILFDATHSRFCLLNRTAAFLWERLGEPQTEAQLTAALRDGFSDVEAVVAERDVADALRQFTELQFVLSEG